MMSLGLRRFLFLLAAAYAVLGAILFVAPTWASDNFAWRVSPFVTMTIGGWSLGTAWASFVVGRRGNWPTAICPITYLALFGIFETAVLVAFRDRVILGNPLAWLYIATLMATILFALAALIEGARRWPVLVPVGPRPGALSLTLTLAFILGVGFLGIYGLVAVEGMRGLRASIFPEVISPFSLRAFGAFYLALALAVVPLLRAWGLNNLLAHGYAMYGLVVLITVAAFVFIDRFDFAGRPTQAIYIGIYLLVGLIIGLFFLRHGTGATNAQQT